MKVTPFLLGSVRPSLKFWLIQAAMLALGVLSMSLPPVLYFGAYRLGLGFPAGALAPMVAIFSITPFAVFFLHLAAAWRAGRRAETRLSRILCRLYVPFALVLTPIVVYKAYFAVNDPFTGKSSQSEAKIALLTIYAGERSLFTEAQSYSTDFGLIGYRPDESRPRYAVAIRLCGKGAASNVWMPANFVEGPEGKSAVLGALRNWMEKEDCTGRDQGFAAFAAGEIRYAKRIDIWRIDEKKRLENVQWAY